MTLAGWLHITAVTALICAGCTVTPASPSPEELRHELEQYRNRRGALVFAETTFIRMSGRYAMYHIRITSDAGLVATGLLLCPGHGLEPSATYPGYPAVLLNDGRELDSRAIDHLPRDFGNVVVLSLDYPAALPLAIHLTDALIHGRQLREAAGQVPSLFSLGASYLAGRADVDRDRIAIAATSFAVPFAVIAAAVDERFRNVVLVYGAGDLDRVLAANLTLEPRALRQAAAWLAMRPFRELEPERYAALIAPRPLVMVNGIDDPQMPQAAVRALYDAAREPKSLVWLRTGHLLPTDSALIRALVDTALARLPVLRGIKRTGETASGDRASRGTAGQSSTDDDLASHRRMDGAEVRVLPRLVERMREALPGIQYGRRREAPVRADNLVRHVVVVRPREPVASDDRRGAGREAEVVNADFTGHEALRCTPFATIGAHGMSARHGGDSRKSRVHERERVLARYDGYARETEEVA
jgi:fermentation-respiration switch protein FrsA (DUF1100 family)